MLPRALLIPPGMTVWPTRERIVAASVPCLLEGRAWSGWGSISRVELSLDGGRTWEVAELEAQVSRHAWVGWRHLWGSPRAGEHELVVRATDAEGNTQPLEQEWNSEGVTNNAVQRVRVTVR
jgi:hypothetical protein